MIRQTRIRIPRSRAVISVGEILRGRVYHALLIPFVVAMSSVLVALALYPTVSAAGHALQNLDRTLLGSSDRALRLPALPERSTIYAADGTPLATLFQDENRVFVPLKDINQTTKDAVLSVEDHKFYEHGPVDVSSIVRAAIANLRAGRIVQGGSTITQQLVKNTELGSAQTFKRKFQEAQDAIRLERTYTKDQILELYLNEVYLGHQVYGIGTAAEYYFATAAAKLNPAQAALLAGMISAPVAYDPVKHKAQALVRRNEVLSLVLKYGKITPLQFTDAIGSPITLSGKQRTGNRLGPQPYWVAYVVYRFEHDPRFGKTLADRKRLLFQGGLKIYTTLQLGLQNAARSIIQNHLPFAGPQPPDDPQGALATVVPQTGAIQAMVGGVNFSKLSYDLAWQGRRSTGSAFKAFTLVAAMQQGVPPGRVYNTATPQDVKGCQAGGWNVHNAEPGNGGFMNLWDATAHSVNVVFAQLIRDIGPQNVMDAAATMGIPRDHMQAVCSLTLGTGVGTNPLEMTSAYSTLANGGVHCIPYAITKVLDRNGKAIFKAKPSCKQVIPPEVAAQVTAMLQGVISRGTGTAAQIGRPEAGKTGTGENYQDAWFMGYVPQLCTGVWVGYSKREIPMRGLRVLGGGNAFGGTLAAPIWHDLMALAVANLPVQNFPTPPPQKGGTVPNVVGMQQAAAEQVLTKANFVPQAKQVDSLKPAGTVVAQNPPGGSGAPLGSLVEIDVSNGKTPVAIVPNVVGEKQKQAVSDLQAAGFQVQIVYQSVPDKSQAGIVLAQSPKGGARRPAGSTVTIIVGRLAGPP